MMKFSRSWGKKFYFTSYTAAFVSFTTANYNVIEPGSVEVGVVLIGSLSFPVDVTVEVTFASAICKPKQGNFTMCVSDVFTSAELDYIGAPFNVTFVEASTQFVAISIVDDDLVERPEVIQLLLTTLTPNVIPIDPNTAQIEITDDDGEIFFSTMHRT
jgi:hypothetical protein